jgi:hypothetical protein
MIGPDYVQRALSLHNFLAERGFKFSLESVGIKSAYTCSQLVSKLAATVQVAIGGTLEFSSTTTTTLSNGFL